MNEEKKDDVAALLIKAEEKEIVVLRRNLRIAVKALREISQMGNGWVTQISNDALIRMGEKKLTTKEGGINGKET